MTRTERRLIPVMLAMRAALDAEANGREIVARDLRLDRNGWQLRIEAVVFLAGGSRLRRFATIEIARDGDEDDVE
jgi:hypothetical protein